MPNKRRHYETPGVKMTSLLSSPKSERLTAKKGTFGRRIIAKGADENYDYTLHATKGFRKVKK